MRKVIYVVFILACLIIIAGKILDWFIDFDPAVSSGLNIAMFSLLGLLWLSWAWAYDHKLIKALFFLGGCYLLIAKWISLPDFLHGLLVVAVIIPFILVRIKPSRFA